MAISPPQPSPAIGAQIDELVSQERELSIQRSRLHRVIDRLYLTAPLGADASAHLEQLEVVEQEISAHRHHIHCEIDRLRAEVGMPPWHADYDDAA